MQDTNKILLHDGREIEHGDLINIPIDQISPNLWNPNSMSDLEFNMLEENIESVGFVAPIVVVPLEDGTFQIADGYHRFEARRISGEKEIPCVVVSPEIFDEKTIMLQTVKLNKIRGSLNAEKFNALIDQLVNKHDIPFEDLAEELGFADEDEFDALVKQGRAQLPKEARKEYDKAVKKIGGSIEKLSKIIERLWLKYSDTLPANFMILEFNNKRHLWVSMRTEAMAILTDLFRNCMTSGYTVDSMIETALINFNLENYVETSAGEGLRRIEDEEGAQETLDDLLEP
jgi:ParB-like chromosome segregation protein Spo0J